MELFELVLLLLCAVLASTVLNEMIPRVSLPLVQIAIGAAVAELWSEPLDIKVDPELFLVLFIAPLLFDESRHADKRALWGNVGSIVSLAVGLVLATVLAVGFALHWLVPSIPLAAAFALGAALGPTDAVAVTALAKDIRLSERQKTLLSGEALINDASGVVSFQFAIAAAVTGTFSIADAGLSFLVSFFGGIAAGAALGLAAVVALRLMRANGFESTTVHVVFEVLVPFVVFLLAEHLGVSGILAVVAAGLVMTFYPQKPTAAASELKIVSGSVWDVLVFVINGVVFVLLGMELALLVSPVWDETGMDRALLAGAVVLVALIVVGVRFAWVLVMEALRRDGREGARRGLSKATAKDALVTTLAGPKGAVTLSIAFTIPYASASGPFPHRADLVFLASGVIVLTLLLATFVVPVLSPRTDEDAPDDLQAELAVLSSVVAQLRECHEDDPDPAVLAVVRTYEERIARIVQGEVPPEDLRALRVEVLERQRAHAEGALARGEASEEACDRYLRRLDLRVKRLSGRRGAKHAMGGGRMTALVRALNAVGRLVGLREESDEEEAERLAIAEGAERAAVAYLEGACAREEGGRRLAAAYLLEEHRSALRMMEASAALLEAEGAGLPSVDGARLRAHVEEVEAEALRLELGQIQRLKQEGLLGRAAARAMREEVYLMQMGLGEGA